MGCPFGSVARCAEPLTTLPRSARSRVSSGARLDAAFEDTHASHSHSQRLPRYRDVHIQPVIKTHRTRSWGLRPSERSRRAGPSLTDRPALPNRARYGLADGE